MKAYSLDLRERVAAACVQPGCSVMMVAAQFSVSASFVEKLLHRPRTTGSVAALPSTKALVKRLRGASTSRAHPGRAAGLASENRKSGVGMGGV